MAQDYFVLPCSEESPGSRSRSLGGAAFAGGFGAPFDVADKLFAIESMWIIPAENPNTAPTKVARGAVCQRPSITYPAMTGNVNSTPIVVIDEAIWMPAASRERSSGRSATHRELPHSPPTPREP